MTLSLIVATLNRTNELERFLTSLNDQNLADIQVVIVDQNPDNRLLPIISEFHGNARIIHKRIPPSLSLARNLGMECAEGDIIAFPDDDCWYPPGCLANVHQLLRDRPEVDGATGQVQDEAGRPIARFGSKGEFVNLNNIWQRGSSVSMFLRRGVIRAVGEFNEDLGLQGHGMIPRLWSIIQIPSGRGTLIYQAAGTGMDTARDTS
jgi:glycosyltransferase involved in cell wall biosynthesis